MAPFICLARFLFVVSFLCSLVAAQTDDCANPRSVVCREHVASVAQASFSTQFPNLRVRAAGDVIVFADPKVFKKQEDRTSYHAVIQNGDLETRLCTFGFKKVRIESSATTTSAGAVPGEQYDLRCPETEEPPNISVEGNKPFDFRGFIPGTTTLIAVKQQVSGLECVVKANQRQVNCLSKGINEEYFYMFADGILAAVEYSFHHLRYLQYKEAFSQKYGPPKSTKLKSYKNLLGAEWQGEVLSWEKDASAIVLSEYGEDINTSQVSVSCGPIMEKYTELGKGDLPPI